MAGAAVPTAATMAAGAARHRGDRARRRRADHRATGRDGGVARSASTWPTRRRSSSRAIRVRCCARSRRSRRPNRRSKKASPAPRTCSSSIRARAQGRRRRLFRQPVLDASSAEQANRTPARDGRRGPGCRANSANVGGRLSRARSCRSPQPASAAAANIRPRSSPEEIQHRQPEIGSSLFVDHEIGLCRRRYRLAATSRANLVLGVEVVKAAAKNAVGFPSMAEERAAAKLAELADGLRQRESDRGIRARRRNQAVSAVFAKRRSRGMRSATCCARSRHLMIAMKTLNAGSNKRGKFSC